MVSKTEGDICEPCMSPTDHSPRSLHGLWVFEDATPIGLLVKLEKRIMKVGTTGMWVVVEIQRSDESEKKSESTDGALGLVWRMRKGWWLEWQLVLEVIRADEMIGGKARERTLAKWFDCFRLMPKEAVRLKKAAEQLESQLENGS